MATLNFKGKTFVQNHHHLTVKYHQLIPKKDKSLTDKISLNDNLIIYGIKGIEKDPPQSPLPKGDLIPLYYTPLINLLTFFKGVGIAEHRGNEVMVVGGNRVSSQKMR